MKSPKSNYPFPTVDKLCEEAGLKPENYKKVYEETKKAETKLRETIAKQTTEPGMSIDSDTSLVLCGSFARYEMVPGSDYDWLLLIDGQVNESHAKRSQEIEAALVTANLKKPGTSGTFGNMVFSHELVHRIGGGADSNANLTRRLSLLLESRPLEGEHVWADVIKNILSRYFEQEVHFSPNTKKIPRFLLNDISRYWRTICVDYASKHTDQKGVKWAIRNAKLRFSRRLIYASGLAFCFNCRLNPPQTDNNTLGIADTIAPFIELAVNFAKTPPLEYLAMFIQKNIQDTTKRKEIVSNIFGSYDKWLGLLSEEKNRKELEGLSHSDATTNELFNKVREIGSKFNEGLELLFFNRHHNNETNAIAKLSLEYACF
jgi:hypothetical protein